MGKTFKIILAGDGRVGKTTFRKQYLGEQAKKDYMMTIGADFAVKKVDFDGENHTLQIWDLAGQPRFSMIRDRYYKAASGMLLMFDLTNRESYDNIPNWLEEFMKNNENRIIPMLLIGNKSDLVDRGMDRIPKNEIDEYIEKVSNWGHSYDDSFTLGYLETSALYDVNIELAFQQLIEKMM